LGFETANMFESVITNLLVTTLYITSGAYILQTPVAQATSAQMVQQAAYVSYALPQDDSLMNISNQYYGSEDFWTNIWNDNTWIVDPENVEKDKIVKIAITKPIVVEELLPELSGRSAELAEQKNQDYLKSIGYLTKSHVEATTESDDSSETAAEAVVTQVTIAPTAVPTQQPVAAASNSSISEEAITALGACEAGNDPAKNTGNGYYGAFQFSPGTWNSMNTGYARADLAPIEVQREAVKQLLSRSSIYNQFPGCAAKMRNQGLIN
jgi:hypothetical protein